VDSGLLLGKEKRGKAFALKDFIAPKREGFSFFKK